MIFLKFLISLSSSHILLRLFLFSPLLHLVLSMQSLCCLSIHTPSSHQCLDFLFSDLVFGFMVFAYIWLVVFDEIVYHAIWATITCMIITWSTPITVHTTIIRLVFPIPFFLLLIKHIKNLRPNNKLIKINILRYLKIKLRNLHLIKIVLI